MKRLIIFTILFSLTLLAPTKALAETIKKDGCESTGECIGGKRCIELTTYDPSTGTYRTIIEATGAACGSGKSKPVLGTVKPPTSILKLNAVAKIGEGENATVGIGLVLFMSRVLLFGSIIAGVWVMFNVISAAFIYITKPGGTDGLESIKEKLTMSAVGLSFIVGAFAIAGIIGLIFFGDAGYILNPQLIGALDSAVGTR